jgi:3-ketosteroid 9alpha-monooxygenase subunit B
MGADTAYRYHALRVSAVIDETHDAKSFVFEVPAALAADYRYKSGQFLTLRLPMDGRHVPRCYSCRARRWWTVRCA